MVNNNIPTTDYFVTLKQQLLDYCNDRLQLLRLQLAEKIAVIITAMISGFIIAGLAFFVLLFVSLMAGYYFAQVFNSFFIGFGIVAGFYTLLLLILLVFKKQLFEKNIISMLLKLILKSEE